MSLKINSKINYYAFCKFSWLEIYRYLMLYQVCVFYRGAGAQWGTSSARLGFSHCIETLNPSRSARFARSATVPTTPDQPHQHQKPHQPTTTTPAKQNALRGGNAPPVPQIMRYCAVLVSMGVRVFMFVCSLLIRCPGVSLLLFLCSVGGERESFINSIEYVMSLIISLICLYHSY